MNSKINKPIVKGTFGKMQEVDDFLPSPDELVLKKPAKLVTLRLIGTPYQVMIRSLIQKYVERQQSRS